VSVRVELEARDPARNVWRRYAVSAAPDLFGTWLVEVSFGRIGAPGRTRASAYSDESSARAFARRCLRRRLSAPRRIGTPYRTVTFTDPDHWLDELGPAFATNG
jgi:predicted DNA-binding WGR domain protein